MSRKRRGDDPEQKPPQKHKQAQPQPQAQAQPQPQQDEPKALTPPESETQEYTELVLLVHAANLPEAELFKTELEAHGVPAVLEGEGVGVAGIPDVGAGVPILVPEEFADQAAELIAELESAKPEETALEEKENIFEEDEDEDLEELEEVDDLEEDLDDDDDSDEDVDEDDDIEEEEEEEEEEDLDEDEDEEWDDEDDEDEDDL